MHVSISKEEVIGFLKEVRTKISANQFTFFESLHNPLSKPWPHSSTG